MVNGPKPRIPLPPHPRERCESLPTSLPSPDRGDRDAEARVKAILESPNYRIASKDPDFLASDAARGAERTVVVFGSARICEAAEARRRVDALRAAAAREPGSPETARRLAVAARVLDNSRYYDMAREFGRIVGKANATTADGRTLIVTGGGPGLMEAANRGASDVKAKSIGLNISLPHEQFPNPYMAPELCFDFHYFAMRKLHFLQRAMALVAFPGGFGTFDELFEVLTLTQTRKVEPMPIVLVGERFWRRAVNMDFLVEEGVIDAEDRDLFWYAETAEEIWDDIQNWERANAECYGADRVVTSSHHMIECAGKTDPYCAM